MNTCPFDMVAIGNAIGESLLRQGHKRCKFIVIVVDEAERKAVASNLIDHGSASRLLIEAAMMMDIADQQEEPVGHA